MKIALYSPLVCRGSFRHHRLAGQIALVATLAASYLIPYEEGIKAVPKINLWPTRSQEVYIPQFNIDSALKPKLKSLLT